MSRLHTGPSRPPSVLLVGGAGPRDLSRDAELAAVLGALRAHGAPDDVTVASTDPRRTIATHAVPAVDASSRRAVASAAARAGAIVLTGTPFGRAAGGIPTARLVALAARARAAGSPVAGVGVGVGELRTAPARMVARELARLTDLLVMRDRTAARDAMAAGVPGPLRVGADPVWTLVDSWPRPAARLEDDVVVVLDGARPGAGARVALADALADLTAAGLRVRIEPWAPDVDLAVAERLRDRVPSLAVADPAADIGDVCARMAGARLVVSEREHAQVAAAAAGVTSLASVRSAGQAELAGGLGQPAHVVCDPATDLATAALRAIDEPPAVESAVKAHVSAAHATFDLLRLVLGLDTDSDVEGLLLESAP